MTPPLTSVVTPRNIGLVFGGGLKQGGAAVVLSKPGFTSVLRQGAETAYGSPEPVLIIEVDENCHHRLAMALVHRLAAAVEMGSLNEQWSVVMPSGFSLMGTGEPKRAVLKIETADGTIEEALRAMTVLEVASSTLMACDSWLRIEFQGPALPKPNPSPYGNKPLTRRQKRMYGVK